MLQHLFDIPIKLSAGKPFNIPAYHKSKYIISKAAELPVTLPINIPSEETKNAAIKIYKAPMALPAKINFMIMHVLTNTVSKKHEIKEFISSKFL